MSARNWIAVASAEHARLGRDHRPVGFMQVGHGKHAPLKRMFWFDDSAHLMMQEQPGLFLMHLVNDVRPLAASAGDVPPGEAARKR